jgi:hypothetical protein
VKLAGEWLHTAEALEGTPVTEITSSNRGYDLDAREFIMESSTASAVDPLSPTRFFYSERIGVVWGRYGGDTVTEGRFIGTRAGSVLTVQFVHALTAGGAPVTGSSTSRIEIGGDGALRLVENFRIDGVEHVSVCIEVASEDRVEG